MSKVQVEKTVYFVRHGESEDNARPVFQSSSSPLSEWGKGQAEKVADRATRLNFQTLISSPYSRAKETAEAIAKATNKEVEYSDLFRERIKPIVLDGKPHDDPESNALSKRWYESLFIKGLKVEDGENYEELVERADKALDFLKNHPDKELLVVTHGFFLCVLICRATLGDSMTEDNLRNFQGATAMKNTGLSVLQLSKWNMRELKESPPAWRLWIYNDHSHLG